MPRSPATPHLLLTGFPGVGKSQFGDWLSQEHGYVHTDLEKHDQFNIGQYFGDQAAAEHVRQILDQVGQPVVISWGFPPHCLPVVMALWKSGIEVFWFDGDRDAARASFGRREHFDPIAMGALDQQSTKIGASWSAIDQAMHGRRSRSSPPQVPSAGDLPASATAERGGACQSSYPDLGTRPSLAAS